MKNILLVIILYSVLSSCLYAQANWKNYKKDSLGVEIIALNKKRESYNPNVKDKDFINSDFFSKYDLNKYFFLEDIYNNVFYIHNNTFFSLTEGIVYIDTVINADIIDKYYEKSINDTQIIIESALNKDGAPNYDYKEYAGLWYLRDPEETRIIFVDSRENVWATHKNGLYYYSEGKWKLFNNLNGLPHNKIVGIYENTNKDSSIWIITKSGYNVYNTAIAQYVNSSEWLIHDKKTGLYGNPGIPKFDTEGNLWIALLPAKGFAKFDGTRWIHYQKKNGLPGKPICPYLGQPNFLIDKNGGLWYLIADGYGSLKGKRRVAHYSNEEWKFYDDNAVRSYVENFNMHEDDKGNIWFYGHKCFIVFDGEKFKKYKTKFTGADESFEDNNGALWLSSIHGLARIKNEQITDYTDSLDFLPIEKSKLSKASWVMKDYGQIFEDSQGAIWLVRLALIRKYESEMIYLDHTTVTEVGWIYRFKDDKWETFNLPDNKGLSIFEDSHGNIWIDSQRYIYKYSY